jgi:hypothetical protein
VIADDGAHRVVPAVTNVVAADLRAFSNPLVTLAQIDAGTERPATRGDDDRGMTPAAFFDALLELAHHGRAQCVHLLRAIERDDGVALEFFEQDQLFGHVRALRTSSA